MAEVSRAEWEAYRIIENMGLYDMFSAEAVRDSGLDKDTYLFIMENYDELNDEFEKETDDE
jgi:hypothetical protein